MAATISNPSARSGGLGGTALTVVTWLVGLLFFFPVAWMLLTAFKQEVDASTDTPKVLFAPTLEGTIDNMRKFRDEVIAKVK